MFEQATSIVSLGFSLAAITVSFYFARRSTHQEQWSRLNENLREMMDLTATQPKTQSNADWLLLLALRTESLIDQIGVEKLEAIDLALLADAFHFAWDPDSAAHYLHLAASRDFTGTSGKNEQLRVLETRGRHLFDNGDYVEARQLLQTAIDLSEDKSTSEMYIERNINLLLRWTHLELSVSSDTEAADVLSQAAKLAGTLSTPFRRERARERVGAAEAMLRNRSRAT